jgi:hypothetical protein
MSITPGGMNALFEIRDNFDLDSNLIEESDPHSGKHLPPKMSIDEGRMISIKPVQINASFAIRDNFDPDSNVIEESDLRSQKAGVTQKVQSMKEE